MTNKLNQTVINHYNHTIPAGLSLIIRNYTYTYNGLDPNEWLEQYNSEYDELQKILTIENRQSTSQDRFIYLDLSSDKEDGVIKKFFKLIGTGQIDSYLQILLKQYPIISKDCLIKSDSILQ